MVPTIYTHFDVAFLISPTAYILSFISVQKFLSYFKQFNFNSSMKFMGK